MIHGNIWEIKDKVKQLIGKKPVITYLFSLCHSREVNYYFLFLSLGKIQCALSAWADNDLFIIKYSVPAYP